MLEAYTYDENGESQRSQQLQEGANETVNTEKRPLGYFHSVSTRDAVA